MGGKNQRISLADDWIHFLIIFSCVLAVYSWSAPRTVAFEDDGLFIMASYFNGTAHPPGYPLFTLLGHIATHIPIGSIAYRVHLLSALFGVLACIAMYLIVNYLLRERLYAYAAALCLAFSRVFWSQAIIAEVYTLNVFIFLLLILLSLYQADEQRLFSKRLFYIMSFLYGLGLCNHWPLLFLSTPAILLILWPVRWTLLRNLLSGIPFLLLGLTPYLWLVIRSHMDPVISFYGPIESWQEFWYMVSRQAYSGIDVVAGADIMDKLRFCWFVLKETAVQIGPFATPFMVIGFIRQWSQWRLSLCLGLLLGYLGSTYILIALLGFSYDVLHQNLFRVYPVNAYAILVLWLVLGVKTVAVFLSNYTSEYVNYSNLVKSLCALIIGTALLVNIPYNYRANDNLAEGYAKTVLKSLDKNAVYFTSSDVDTFTLGYFNLVENIRLDVTLYHPLGLVFSTRLFDPIFITDKRRHRILSEFIEDQDRPIYYKNDIPRLYGRQHYGAYSKLDKSLEKDEILLLMNRNIMGFYERLLDRGEPYDHWERMVQHNFLADYCRLVTSFVKDEEYIELNKLRSVCTGYSGLLVLIDMLLNRKDTNLELVEELIDEAGKLRFQALNAKEFAIYDILNGRFMLLRREPENARQSFNRAIREWPDSANEAYRLLKEINPEKNSG